MNCCDSYGKCTQGANCPIRSQCGELPKPIETDVDIVEEFIYILYGLVTGALLVVMVVCLVTLANK